MKFTFEVLNVEEEIAFVSSPQITVFDSIDGQRNIIIYFMANTAIEIIEGHAVSGLGKVKLFYTAASKNNVLTASNSIRKVVYKFSNPQGMANQVEFHGQKT